MQQLEELGGYDAALNHQYKTFQDHIKREADKNLRLKGASLSYSSQSKNPWLMIYPGGNCFGFTMGEVLSREGQKQGVDVNFDLVYNQRDQSSIKGHRSKKKGFVFEAAVKIKYSLRGLKHGDTLTFSFGASDGKSGHITSLKRINERDSRGKPGFKGYEFVDCNNVRIRYPWGKDDAASFVEDHIKHQSYTDPAQHLSIMTFYQKPRNLFQRTLLNIKGILSKEKSELKQLHKRNRQRYDEVHTSAGKIKSADSVSFLTELGKRKKASLQIDHKKPSEFVKCFRAFAGIKSIAGIDSR